MALIKCNECGHEVSDKASACPNCGCPIQYVDCSSENVTSGSLQSSKKWRVKTYVLITVILCMVVGGGYYSYTLHFDGKDVVEIVKNLFKGKDIVELTPEFIEAVRKYDELGEFSEGFAAVKKDGKWGFINTKGKDVIPCRYDGVYSFSEGFAMVENEDKYGFINTKGQEVIPCKYDNVGCFSEGFATVMKDGGWGFINTKGEEIVPYKYDHAFPFSEGLALVEQHEKCGYINNKGEEVIPCKYDFNYSVFYLYYFSEGLAAVMKNGKWGFVNTKGKEIISFKYDEASPFSNGFASVAKSGKYCFINVKGEEVIPYKYDRVNSFSEGFAAVNRGEKWGFINTKGKEVISCKYDNAGVFSEGLAAIVKNEKWGFINTKGEEVIPCKYDYDYTESETYFFSEGFAIVKEGNKYGFINTKGEEVIPCKYDYIYSFSKNGVALAYLDCGEKYIYGFIDKFGNTTFTQSDIDKQLAYERQREEERIAEEERRIQEEEEERLAAMKPNWIQGTWVYSSSYGTSKVVISGNNIVVYMDGSLVYNGSYEIRDGNLYYNRHNGMSDYIVLDKNSQRLKADESTYFNKVSSSSSTSSSNNGSVYSTDEGRTAYMEVLQLQKEVRALIDRSAPYRRIMQSSVYGSYNYQVASIQNVRILDAAIQKQEKALRIAKNKLHDESLIRELSGQLGTLKKAKYSD